LHEAYLDAFFQEEFDHKGEGIVAFAVSTKAFGDEALFCSIRDFSEEFARYQERIINPMNGKKPNPTVDARLRRRDAAPAMPARRPSPSR
jgi:hypothetical protein